MEFGPLEIGTLLALSGGALGLLSRERDKARMHALDTWDRRLRGQEIAAQAHVGALAAVHQPAYPSLHTAHFAAPLAVPSVTTVDAPQLPAAPVPTFAALLAGGQIGAGQPLCQGYSEGQPVLGTLAAWRSGAIAGLPGAGKTTTQRFIAGQAALQGARLVVLDPHADAGDDSLAGTLAPLTPAYLCQAASDPRAMLAALRLVQDIMQARLSGGPVDYPLFVFVDEFTALMGRSDLAPLLSDILEAIAQEGRKTQVQGVISGQIWTAARAGGTALRDSLASTYCHRMRRKQAAILLPTEDARRAETLATGAAILWRADGTVVDVQIPYTSAADMATVGRQLSRPGAVPVPSTVDAPAWWDVLTDGTRTAPAGTADGRDGTAPDAYTASVISRFKAGTPIKVIIEELHPDINTAAGGRPYRDKRDALETLIAAELRRLAGEG